MRNVHRMFITYIHRTQESRNTKNAYDFLVQVRNFLLPLSLKVLRHKEERCTIFLCWLFHLPPRPNLVRHLPQGHWPGFSEQAKVDPSRSVSSLNSTNFLQNSQNPSRASNAWRHSHSLPPFPIRAIVISLSDMSAPRTRVNTCVNVAPK